jgi:hypothetical protein
MPDDVPLLQSVSEGKWLLCIGPAASPRTVFGEVSQRGARFMAHRRDGVERFCGSLAEAEEFIIRHTVHGGRPPTGGSSR